MMRRRRTSRHGASLGPTAGDPAASRRPGGFGRLVGVLLAGVLTFLSAGLLALPASAAPVYEITARWAPNTPTTVVSGDVVNAEWRVNVNDDQPAPSNDPVDNVNFTLTIANGRFRNLPESCLTTDVTPVSSISVDEKTLVCNLGAQRQGTAHVVQTGILADGPTGSQITAGGTIAGDTADLAPIDIVNQFGEDIRWGTPSSHYRSSVDADTGLVTIDMDFAWTLSLALRGGVGPSSVTYDLTVTSQQAQTIGVGPDGCTPISQYAANGHPWSGGNHPADQTAPFVGSCTLTQTGPNAFSLVLTGIDNTMAQAPTKDSTGAALPSDQVAIASGAVWIRVVVPRAGGSVVLDSSEPTYNSPSGPTAQDDPSNNTSTKTWTAPGTYANIWSRGSTGSGGTNWDDTYRVAAETDLDQWMSTGWAQFAAPANHQLGMCSALDTRYVTFKSNAFWPSSIPDAVIEYYTGSSPQLDPASGSYDPDAFDCDTGGTGPGGTGWSTSPPADLSDVKAVRVHFTRGDLASFTGNVAMRIWQTVKPTAPPGTDVWTTMSIRDGGAWTHPAVGCITATPGARYACTSVFRDIVRIVVALPAVSKSVDRSVVRPGVPATYTLTYSANGAGSMPGTVDDYEIVDTLPEGMTYVSGSASPEPVVSMDGNQQVLTWNLDGVTTNVQHTLSYRAVAADSVTPGQTLTNTVVTSYSGQSTRPARAQVTVATNGYTDISKTSDLPFIPRPDGSEGSWTVTLRSFDPLPQSFTDTIDILPWEGDQRGTSFSGTYSLAGVETVPGATVYYSDADPASLSDDPAHASNGSAGDIAGNSVNWSTTKPEQSTAVRVIGPELAAGATQQFRVRIATSGAVGGDRFVNRAQARDGHTELVMRTSAPLVVASRYSAALKKYVLDREGKWRDANDVADAPAFQYGDTVRYRIVITNTGEGTLTNIDVSDDRQPALGAFHVDSLAPGATESHEFEMVLGQSVTGTLTNTACAEAETPPDAEGPPTINCDPAMLKVANYQTVKTAGAQSGASVQPGDKVTYTVTVTQEGGAPAEAQFSDDLADVLDDATYNHDVEASSGEVEYRDGHIGWTGSIPVGGKAVITYSVTVKDIQELEDDGSFGLRNVVSSDGCAVVDGNTPRCTTNHPIGYYVYSKTSNPKAGSTVQVGDTITYTVRVAQRGKGSVDDARITDDLSKVLDDATYNRDVEATAGEASVSGNRLTWTGDLTVRAEVVITYSVRVVEAGDKNLVNVVTGIGDLGSCVPAPDQNPDCTTKHTKPESPPLPDTGSAVSPLVIGTGIALVLLGAGALWLARRRRNS